MKTSVQAGADKLLLETMQRLTTTLREEKDSTTRLQIRGEMRGIRSAFVTVFGTDNPFYREIVQVDTSATNSVYKITQPVSG